MYDQVLFDDGSIYNPNNATRDNPDPSESLIQLFASMEESEILDFLSNPIAWKDYSSQTFRYTPAAGNWTLLISNTNQNLGTRIKSAKMIFNVA